MIGEQVEKRINLEVEMLDKEIQDNSKVMATEIEIAVQVILETVIEHKDKEDLETAVILEIKVDSLKETTTIILIIIIIIIIIISIEIIITTTTGMVIIIKQTPQVGIMTKSDNERKRERE